MAGADAKEIHIECVCLLARPDCCRSVDYLDCVYRFDIFRCSVDYLDCGICKSVFDVEVYISLLVENWERLLFICYKNNFGICVLFVVVDRVFFITEVKLC